ncbi:TIGR01777 family oxidoreductase [Pleionea sediminis]|uniref:TIGR01777 family oxidoreductase n=1 Tax=Pleionea sediminis TaxID=2569479 RepID=UPI001186BF43|nr:TIGR01777 family oxidoreductase [Pleionea sediminis]
MKIFITGISGLIGRHLAQTFKTLGHSVSGLTRDIDSAAKTLPPTVSLVSSLQDASDFMPDVVINLAGEPIADKRWSKKRKQAIRESRINLTRDLVQWMSELEQSPDVFISGSAIGYYGRQGDNEVDESSAPHDEFTHQLCREWEAEAMKAESFTRVCIIRTGLVVTGEGGFLDKMKLPFSLGLGGRLGNGKQFMSWIHLHDMISGIEFLIEKSELSGVFNFTAPNPVTNQTFTKTLGRVIGRPTVFPVPGFVLRIMLGEMSDLLLTGQRVKPKRLSASGYEFQYHELEDALKEAFKR